MEQFSTNVIIRTVLLRLHERQGKPTCSAYTLALTSSLATGTTSHFALKIG